MHIVLSPTQDAQLEGSTVDRCMQQCCQQRLWGPVLLQPGTNTTRAPSCCSSTDVASTRHSLTCCCRRLGLSCLAIPLGNTLCSWMLLKCPLAADTGASADLSCSAAAASALLCTGLAATSGALAAASSCWGLLAPPLLAPLRRL